MARQAAKRTGLSQTSVVEQALESFLASMDDEVEARLGRVDQILVYIHTITATWIDEDRDALSTDDLYDEDGLFA